jgi:hypothetical protein
MMRSENRAINREAAARGPGAARAVLLRGFLLLSVP